MIRKARLVVCIAALFLLQVTLAHRFTYRFLRPDLLYTIAVFIALEADSRGALCSAFALGILRDLGSSGRLGTSAFLFVLASYGMLWLRERLMRERAWVDMVLVFGYVLVCELAQAAGVALATAWVSADDFMPRALGVAIYTSALSPLLFAAFARLGLVAPRPGR